MNKQLIEKIDDEVIIAGRENIAGRVNPPSKNYGQNPAYNRTLKRIPLIPVIKCGNNKREKLTDKDESIGTLFNAYFRNKMYMITLMLQHTPKGIDAMACFKAIIFLDDLYHHLIRREYQTSYARVFQWLKLFFRRYPNVKAVQKRKAIEYIRVVSGLFGLELDPMI